MKNLITFLAAFMFIINTSIAQNGAAINTSGAAADPSAILDISSTDAGILVPRMTVSQKNLIINPAVGLMIYQTDGISGFWYYNGTEWIQSLGAKGADGATGVTGATGANGILPPGDNFGNTPYWDGYQWIVNSSNIFNDGTSVGIGTTTPDQSSVLDLFSNSKGLIIPRMTTIERDAIAQPVEGLQIINTTTKCLEIFFSPKWQKVFCGCANPAAPTEGVHSANKTQIIWNWNSVIDAQGYKWNSVNDYATANDLGSSTSFSQQGLTCESSFLIYIWAYNNCGQSSVASLSYGTTPCFICGDDAIVFNYFGNNVTYGTVVGQNGTCWMDRNLGASAVATSYNHSAAYGDLFQWGRLADGHQLRTSLTTTALSSSDIPNHSDLITSSSSPNDWRSPQNDTLWLGATGTNNPCPANWRLPSFTELDDERNQWSAQNYNGAFTSPLKLTAGGYRASGSGTFGGVNTMGRYWSYTIGTTGSFGLAFDASSTSMSNVGRGNARSVRCIKDY